MCSHPARTFGKTKWILPLLTTLSLVSGLGGCYQYDYVEIASGTTIQDETRTALAEDGTVVAAVLSRSFRYTRMILAGDGLSLHHISLGPREFSVFPNSALGLSNQGDIVFVAEEDFREGCDYEARGAYHVPIDGGPITTLRETCEEGTDGKIGTRIAVSPNGTVAFSSIHEGGGSLFRGPASGPVSVLRSGSTVFFNTGHIAVTDAGRVTIQMEYLDANINSLRRGMLVFDAPEQPQVDIDSVVEKADIGFQPEYATNNSGTTVFAENHSFEVETANGPILYPPGVYLSTPTPFNTPKDLTLFAGLEYGYCQFGAVDINDAGDVVFEAIVDDGQGCDDEPNGYFDGLFRGPNPLFHAAVARGDADLGDHQYFDEVILGQINNAGQISFTTTYSEPLVSPVKVWRADPLSSDSDTEPETTNPEEDNREEDNREEEPGRDIPEADSGRRDEFDHRDTGRAELDVRPNPTPVARPVVPSSGPSFRPVVF